MSETQRNLFGLPATRETGGRHLAAEPPAGPPANANPQSQAAAKAIGPRAGTLAARVFAYLDGRGQHGATNYEIVEDTGILLQTVCGRIADLRRPSPPLIVASDRTRPSPNGHAATVWVTKQHATYGVPKP